MSNPEKSLLADYQNTEFYPYIVARKDDSILQTPQNQRSDVRKFSSNSFFEQLQNCNFPISARNNVSLVAEGKAIPYEPEIALIDESANLYIAVEIDIPYNGYFRFPTNYGSENENRDNFFTENGWFIVHFSEEQIVTKTSQCINFLKNLVLEIENNNFDYVNIQIEKRWSIKDAVNAEKDLKREKYLQISEFEKPAFFDSIIENVKNISKNSSSEKPTIIFNEETHTYSDSVNQRGSANYISVTTLIEKFFPIFDEEDYIKRFMEKSGKTEEEVRKKMLEPSILGTKMHRQIELFYKGEEHEEDFKEFELFKLFNEEQIKKRGLVFYDAEKQIIFPKYCIAGTVDALFQKPGSNEYVMVDWKRSKNLIIDGYTKKYGFGTGLSIVSHLDNSSYYHYELQQSFYKYILEREYNMKISSMILAVLYPEYDRYYTIKLSNYREKEVIEMIAAHACNYI